MAIQQLKEFLHNHATRYSTIRHARAYTASETAQAAHIAGKLLAKTVIVKVDGRMAMVVLPSPEHIDMTALKRATGAAKVELASEAEFKRLFPNCEVGAMPPFGNLYGLEVFVCASLTEDEEIAFNAGSHVDAARDDILRFFSATARNRSATAGRRLAGLRHRNEVLRDHVPVRGTAAGAATACNEATAAIGKAKEVARHGQLDAGPSYLPPFAGDHDETSFALRTQG